MNDLPVWAVRLRHERRSRKWSPKYVARQLIDAASGRIRAHMPTHESLARMVRTWEAGKHRPSEPYPQLLAQIFGVTEEELFADPPNATDSGEAPEGTLSWKAPDGDNDMERRRLLQIAAASAGIGILGVSGEPVRQLLDLSLSHDFRSGEEWEMSCDDHLHALRTRPPAQVVADLVIDLHLLRRQMETSSPAEVTGLQRVLAALSAVHGNALTRMGDHGAAVRWWHTARHAADASGDREVRLLVRGEEAGTGLYGQRTPETVLRLVRNAERIAGGPSVDLLTTQAKALSMLGKHEEARETLNALVDLAAKGATGDSIGFWKENQIYFAESWVHASAGDEDKAATARENVLRLTGDYQYGANIMLHEALCTVVRGGIDEGVRRAATVIDALSPAYRSRYILETGQMLLRAVPHDQQNRPTIGEFREVLAIEAAT
ncbi:helix-turn-helix transcriptional regulator [Streptosporangium oxazolinicum]